MRKPNSNFSIVERAGFYYLRRNNHEQLCPENFKERVNCGSWCPFFTVRLEDTDSGRFYYVFLNCRQAQIGFKIKKDIEIIDAPDGKTDTGINKI